MTEILSLFVAVIKRYQSIPLPMYGTISFSVKMHQGKPQSPRLIFEDTTDPTAEELRQLK